MGRYSRYYVDEGEDDDNQDDDTDADNEDQVTSTNVMFQL